MEPKPTAKKPASKHAASTNAFADSLQRIHASFDGDVFSGPVVNRLWSAALDIEAAYRTELALLDDPRRRLAKSGRADADQRLRRKYVEALSALANLLERQTHSDRADQNRRHSL